MVVGARRRVRCPVQVQQCAQMRPVPLRVPVRRPLRLLEGQMRRPPGAFHLRERPGMQLERKGEAVFVLGGQAAAHGRSGIRYGLEPKNVTPRRGKPSAKWARPLRPDVTPRGLSNRGLPRMACAASSSSRP
jgi:hypothetical protein